MRWVNCFECLGGQVEFVCFQAGLKYCFVQYYSRDRLDWGNMGMKKRERCVKLGLAGLGSLMEKPQHCRSLACSLYTTEQRGRAAAYSWRRKWGYHWQINKESVFMVYSWVKEAGLATLQRAVSVRGSRQIINIHGEEDIVVFFSVHTINTINRETWNQKKTLRLSHR